MEKTALATYRHFEKQDLRYVFQGNAIDKDITRSINDMHMRNGFGSRSRKVGV